MKNKKKLKKFLFFLLACLFFFYIGHTLEKFFELSGEKIIFNQITWAFDNFDKYPLLDCEINANSSLFGYGGVFLFIILYLRFKNKYGTYRYGEEHGSAKLLTLEEVKTFEDSIEENNIIFTKNAKMGLYNDRLPYSKKLNKNVLVLGGPGSGKTYTFVKPNAMQLNGSKIFTDTKGLLVRELGNLYEKNGYRIKIIDLITFENSNHFNIFKYIKKETDIDKVASSIVEATKKSDNKGEDFWIRAEYMLMTALIGFLHIDGKLNNYEPHLGQVTKLIKLIERKEEHTPSVLERLMQDLNEKLPNNFAYRQFENFNLNFKSETRNSVKAIITARFSVFEHEEINDILKYDDLEIETWNTQKTAVFINVPEVNDAYQFISALLFQTIFETTIKTADSILKGEVENKNLLHLEIYGDEFAQMGKIYKLSNYISVFRSREISIKIILQGLPQLEALYGKEEAKSIQNNCDTILCLGTNDKDTMEYLSFRGGNQTIDDKNYSENRNTTSGGSNLQHSKLKRELFTAHEIGTISTEEALLFIGKQNAFKDLKASVDDHKNKKYLANSPKDKNWYKYKIYNSEYEYLLANTKKENQVEVKETEVLQGNWAKAS